MLLREEDSLVFKDWLLPKLDTISDADAEVLADYVIALVTGNESEETVRENCLESLADFLQDNTVSFVDDIFKVLKTKSYALSNLTRAQASGARLQSPRQQQPQASRAAPIPSIVGTSNSDYEPQAARSSNVPPLHAPKGPAATRAGSAQHRLPDRPTALSPAQSKSPGANTQHLSRKRKLVQRDTSETREGQDPHYNRVSTATRPTKQAARRSGKNLRGGAAAFEPHNSFPSFTSMPNMLSMANLPPPPPGPLPFDMSNPMAFFAMMAALGTTMPGMPTLPLITPQSTPTSGQARRGKCHDYHTKGFCARGTMCLFEHGNTSATPDEVPEYDPDQPSLSMRSTLAPSRRQGTKGLKGGRPRASFSLPGPAYDQNNTTLVVEQIPEDKFSEDHVRDFFSQFGPIVDLHMHAFKRLAIVKFEDHASADQAYNSPRAVFENRFVKVYWHRNNSVPGGAGTIDDDDVLNGDEEVLDLEEIERRQAEAQKAFEERRRRIEEADAKSAEIDRQLLEKDAEMKKIRQQLAELAGDETDGNKEEEFSQDLATLQAEAESLFAQNDHIPSSGRGRGYPPRGAFRGRRLAPFPPRGRGAHRGGYRGRGAFAAPFPSNRSSVKRLDNRPKRLAVTGIEKGSMKDEALRQYLVNMPECTSIEMHPDQSDTLVLTFQERFQAEMFLDNSRKIPDTGPLELSWVPNDALGGPMSASAPGPDADASDGDSSATAAEDERAEESRQEEDADMDVADDVDQWM